MIVTLIGYRGSGKTVVGRDLAGRLGLEFVDADEEISRLAGQGIAEIFASEGEAGFRARETEVMVRLLAGDGLVIAAGGGAVLDPVTRRAMTAAGPVAWLTASVDELARRIAADSASSQQRPSLTGDDVLEEIADVLGRREPLYAECAAITLGTDSRSIEEIVEELAERLSRESGEEN